MNWIRHYFEIDQRGTSVAQEFRAAVATFLTMAYIIVVNPLILSAADVPMDSAASCTALAAGICCLLMGFYARFPIALASGMGLNAFLVGVALQTSWPTAMGLVVLDGLIILALVLCGVRESLFQAIPIDLRRAMAVGIGLFIALIGAVNSGLVVADPHTLITHGGFTDKNVVVALLGVLAIAILLVKEIKGAILIGIGFSTAVHYLWPESGLAEQIAETSVAPNRSGMFSLLFDVDLGGALQWTLLPALITLLMVDFFDTLGTVSAIGEQAELRDADDNIIGLRKILVVDSVSAAIGGACGVSSVTSYIESAAGVSEGARTGLHSVFVGCFFLAGVFLAPLAAFIPKAATAPALIIVGFYMTESVSKIDFKSTETGIPAFLTIILIPMTYSISHGIGYGLIAYVAIRLFVGRIRETHPMLFGAAVIFGAVFIWGQ